MNRRILIVDDQLSLHADYAKALSAAQRDGGLADAKAAFFGEAPAPQVAGTAAWELVFASQGQEALALVEAARREGRPFALAFVDMRMPPGWDGVETIEHLWTADSDLEVVICTAFADYSLAEIGARLGRRSQLLILKKPFDIIEVQQLASALTAKWDLVQTERAQLESVRKAEAQTRAYAASLSTINTALGQAKAAAESNLQSKNRLLEELSAQLSAASAHILQAVEELREHGEPSAAHQVEGLDQDLAIMARIAMLSAHPPTAEHEECALPALLESCGAFANGPIPARIHADAGMLHEVLQLLRAAQGKLEVEYQQGDGTLRWHWTGDSSRISGMRGILLAALCRVLGIELESSEHGLELRHQLGSLDGIQLVLHPPGALPAGIRPSVDALR